MDHNQDFSNNSVSGSSSPVPPPPPNLPPQAACPTSVRPVAGPSSGSFGRSFFRTVFRAIFIFSLILNAYLLVIISSGMQQQEYRSGTSDSKIALIDVENTIDMQTAYEFRSKLMHAAEDAKVQGVILVVNSPGGYVPPTEMIHRYIQDFKDQSGKPLYAVIEQVGASGSYWVSSAADKIYAQTNSIVGSIGVLYMNMVLETALKEKLGVDPVIIKSTRSPFKDHLSPFRQPTEEELSDIRHDLDRIHERFVKVVSENRGIDMEQTWALADGDVHDGPEALELKLIDKIGFLDDAIDDLAAVLGIEDPKVVRYMRPPTLREIVTAASRADNLPSLDIQKHIEHWAMKPKIAALWLGR